MIHEFNAEPAYVENPNSPGTYVAKWLIRVAIDLSQVHAVHTCNDPDPAIKDHAVIRVGGRDQFTVQAPDFDRLLKDWRASRAA